MKRSSSVTRTGPVPALARPILLSAAIAGLAACAAAPHGPPPDIVRLQQEHDRLHADPRLAANGGAELANADAALAALSANARALDSRSYQQGVYLTDKLQQVAEASALARDAEARGEQLGIERDRLAARGARGEMRVVAASQDLDMRERAPLPDSRARLFAIQRELLGSESSVDERGLVVRLADFNFGPGESGLTASGERSLANLARALDDEPRADVSIVAYGDRGLPRAHAKIVRDYLDARGIDPARLDVREARRDAPPGGARGDVLVVVRE
jgi:outer membrane protein OmpA-like peptidoglycan-associated protein